MLTELSLCHFKCFELLKLPLAPLTLLSGTNATGKSTVLQGLLLLHQTLQFNQSDTSLTLNGYAVQLGAVGDVVDQISGRRNIEIGVQSETFECIWTMEADDRRMLTFPVKKVEWRESPDWNAEQAAITQNVSLRNLLPPELRQSPSADQMITALLQLSYISADRSGPRETYPVAVDNLYPTVGPRGENAPWYLYTFDQKETLSQLRFPNEISPYLRRQVDAWMNYFFPGAGISVEQIPDTNLVKLLLRTSNQTDFHRPQNVGYGLTHLLPIVTACLGGQKGDIIIVENPETHLHPAAQSAIGEFLARVASAGVQIILETHSDHVLNGIRKAVKQQIATPDNVLIHFFAPRSTVQDNDTPQVTSPLIDQTGNLDYWPNNFFDQFDRDANELIDWEI